MKPIKVIIAGGRDFSDYEKLFVKCRNILSNYRENGVPVEIVSGDALGADRLGEKFAKHEGYSVKKFIPNWDLFGKVAGLLRNGEMADYADVLIAFWDGRSKGTANMIQQARQNNLMIRIIRY